MGFTGFWRRSVHSGWFDWVWYESSPTDLRAGYLWFEAAESRNIYRKEETRCWPSPPDDSQGLSQKCVVCQTLLKHNQPYIYPSLFMDSLPQIKGQPFNRKKPIFLPPYSRFPVIDHARVAWLIPIRGVFPWNGCSSAVLLDSTKPLPVEENLVQWNSASLLKFWSFLLELRKAASLGSLGISLHSARQPVEISTLQPVESRSATLSRNPPHHSPPALSTVDYIKVYHDASTSFHVRKAVDSWSYHLEAGQTKVRVLKSATLPLVDEISSGILLLWNEIKAQKPYFPNDAEIYHAASTPSLL